MWLARLAGALTQGAKGSCQGAGQGRARAGPGGGGKVVSGRDASGDRVCADTGGRASSPSSEAGRSSATDYSNSVIYSENKSLACFSFRSKLVLAAGRAGWQARLPPQVRLSRSKKQRHFGSLSPHAVLYIVGKQRRAK